MKTSKINSKQSKSRRSGILRSESKKINDLAEQHSGDPDGFFQFLDDFSRNMCMEMVNAKGGML